MHNSTEGNAAAPSLPQYTAGPFLLRGADQSSVCLNCHEAAGDVRPTAYHVSTSAGRMPPGLPPVQLTPGGDFGWLRKTYAWTATTARTSPGERHGHNVVATDYGYQGDTTLSTAPGGTYPSASLACTSCHDPHGRYRRLADGSIATTGQPVAESGSYANSPDPVAGASAVGVYRLLGGIGYQPRSVTGSYAFANDPPAAVAPPVYNRSEAVTQTRVAYGQGMSEWCSNCHPSMLRTGLTSAMKGIVHPVGNTAKLTGAIVTNYNAYLMTGKLTNIDSTKSYWSLVPFEEGTADYGILKPHARNDDAYLNGPDINSTVSCITCHRAHASGFDSVTRFRVGNEFITVSDAAGGVQWPSPSAYPVQAQGREVVETQQAYYGRPATAFAPYQRELCNKCHVKD
jgi:cytochrome c553